MGEFRHPTEHSLVLGCCEVCQTLPTMRMLWHGPSADITTLTWQRVVLIGKVLVVVRQPTNDLRRHDSKGLPPATATSTLSLLQAVLYGIFPVVLFGALVSYLRLRLLRRPLHHLARSSADPSRQLHLREIYRSAKSHV